MEKLLKVYKYIDGISDSVFPNNSDPIEIADFQYNAQRMGSAPSITATIWHFLCLDDLWDNKVYVTFNGEKYYIRNTPTSSYSSDDSRYKHEVEFVSERRVLDNVYFYDVVTEEYENDRPVSNSSNVVFFGDIHEFAQRLKYSLAYAKIDYDVVVDEGIESEAKLMSFQDQFFSNVLQEVYNTYEVPYYFVGKTIHIGYTDNSLDEVVFKYGIENSLLSITKTNANYKTVNRCTGVGSTDNIHYYYPMSTEGVEVLFDVASEYEKSRVEKIIASKVASYAIDTSNVRLVVNYIESKGYSKIGIQSLLLNGAEYEQGAAVALSSNEIELTYTIQPFDKIAILVPNYQGNYVYDYESLDVSYRFDKTSAYIKGEFTREIGDEYAPNGCYVLRNTELGAVYEVKVKFKVTFTEPSDGNYYFVDSDTRFYSYEDESNYFVDWNNLNSGASGRVKYDKSGIVISDLKPQDSGFTITTKDTISIPHSEYLMPTVYRNSEGAERFYNAINYPFEKATNYVINEASGEYIGADGLVHNDKYKNPNTGGYYRFDNVFAENNPLEHKESFEDIKPTIKNIKNSDGKLFGSIADIAFDSDDNDETDEEGNFEHPYFYIKLNKFDGEFGFNLFDHALEDGEMTLSMTSGNCGACEFVVQVVETTIDGKQVFQNPVQVNGFGDIVSGSKEDKINTTNIQPQQQDTVNNEVWIAVKKDINTYGVVMPNVLNNYKPSIGDEFVILHIGLPNEYIYAAEAKLDEHILAYMAENNSEKFTFDIKFSRIYFQENKDILHSLTENSRINIQYNGKVYPLYVSSYTYSAKSNEALPEISVSLSEVITISKNAIDNAVSGVRMEFVKEINAINIVGESKDKFIRKDIDDVANNKLTLKDLAITGNLSLQGGKLENITLGSLSNTNENVDRAQKDCVLVTTEDGQWGVKNLSDITPTLPDLPDFGDFVKLEDLDDYYTKDECDAKFPIYDDFGEVELIKIK